MLKVDQVSPGYVTAESQVPAMPQGRGFSLAVAGDAVNQLLGSFWAARGMDKAFDLETGGYGQIGKLNDRVEISAQVPPYVDASGGSLKLTIGSARGHAHGHGGTPSMKPPGMEVPGVVAQAVTI